MAKLLALQIPHATTDYIYTNELELWDAGLCGYIVFKIPLLQLFSLLISFDFIF